MVPIFHHLQRIYNQPLAAWLLAPVIPLLTGTIIGAKSTAFQFYPFLLLFLYQLFLFTMELVLRKKLEKKMTAPPALKGVFLTGGVLILILLAVATNWIISALLLLIGVFYILAYSEQIRMAGTPYYLVLQIFFQGIIIGFLSFYAQTGFLDSRLLVCLLPSLLFISAFAIIQEEHLLNHRGSSLSSGRQTAAYQAYIADKEPLLVLILTIAAILASFLLFLYTDTEGWKQLVFLLILLLLAFPLFSLRFRRSLNHLTFFPINAAIITLLFTLLVNSIFP